MGSGRTSGMCWSAAGSAPKSKPARFQLSPAYRAVGGGRPRIRAERWRGLRTAVLPAPRPFRSSADAAAGRTGSTHRPDRRGARRAPDRRNRRAQNRGAASRRMGSIAGSRRTMILLPIAVAVLLLISALLAASETALFALVRMEHTRDQPERLRAACARSPDGASARIADGDYRRERGFQRLRRMSRDHLHDFLAGPEGRVCRRCR